MDEDNLSYEGEFPNFKKVARDIALETHVKGKEKLIALLHIERFSDYEQREMIERLYEKTTETIFETMLKALSDNDAFTLEHISERHSLDDVTVFLQKTVPNYPKVIKKCISQSVNELRVP